MARGQDNPLSAVPFTNPCAGTLHNALNIVEDDAL